LDKRARSYLDVNCSACHRDGGARSQLFAEFHRTADPAALSVKPSQGDFGIANARIVAPGDPFGSVLYYRVAKLGQGRMPFVGAHEQDREGMELLRQWISQMRPEGDDRRQADDAASERIAELTTETFPPGDSRTESAIAALLGDTRSAFALWQSINDGAIGEPLRSEIIARANASESAAVRDLYEWFIDAEHRTQRLGANFDPMLVLQQPGDAERGRALYADKQTLSCGNCHATEPQQPSIGPNLADIGRKLTRHELLQHIVNPSLRIDPQYAVWTVETSAGQLLSGMLASRTDDEIVLRDDKGQEHRISADDVEFMQKQPRSLMPDQLLQSLTPSQAADLLSFLRSLK
ncbi:MAG: c-type cytochrome, partial [Planctomycetales bacterium]|nr:c-type cytochrome [Planctomycetales bacterium]